MDINEMIQAVRDYDYRNLFRLTENSGVLTQEELMTAVISVVFGLLLCFFGLKAIRLWAALAGFVLGFAAGTAAAVIAGAEVTAALIAGVVCGVIIAALAAVLYRVGVFVYVFLAVSVFCSSLVDAEKPLFAGLCLAVGLVAAILSIRFMTVLTILATSVYGAAVSGTALCRFLPVQSRFLHLAVCAVLCIAGILIQLLLESKKQKKRSLKKAAEIREENSTANEVERARAVMDRLDSMPAENPEEEE